MPPGTLCRGGGALRQCFEVYCIQEDAVRGVSAEGSTLRDGGALRGIRRGGCIEGGALRGSHLGGCIEGVAFRWVD